jgi:hypothetical protein
MDDSFWKIVLDHRVQFVHFIAKDLIELKFYDGSTAGARMECGRWHIFQRC